VCSCCHAYSSCSSPSTHWHPPSIGARPLAKLVGPAHCAFAAILQETQMGTVSWPVNGKFAFLLHMTLSCTAVVVHTASPPLPGIESMLTLICSYSAFRTVHLLDTKSTYRPAQYRRPKHASVKEVGIRICRSIYTQDMCNFLLGPGCCPPLYRQQPTDIELLAGLLSVRFPASLLD
jgi:hypothetical protein